MTDAMFSPSSPHSSDHDPSPEDSLEHSLNLPTAASGGGDPAAELFSLFETHFQSVTETNGINESDLDAIANALATEQPDNRELENAPIQTAETIHPAETDIPWFNLAQKLREQNQTLIQRVVELEQVLGDTKHQSQAEIRRLRNLSDELEQTQSQIRDLSQQRDIYQQESQQQRLQLETLTEQLDRSQSNLAQLERDCALLQEDNNGKTHQLAQLSADLTYSQANFAQLERSCVQLQEDNNSKIHEIAQLNTQVQELRSRLQRQQRYALEYKAALDQALAQSRQPVDSTLATAPLPTLTIQPWSQAASPTETDEALSDRATPSEPSSVGENTPDPTVTPPLAVDTTAPNDVKDESIEPVSEIEAEVLASIKDHLERNSVTAEARSAEPDIIPEPPEEPPVFTAIKPYPVFTRSFAISPSFAINPTKKQAPPAKKVELPTFLRNR